METGERYETAPLGGPGQELMGPARAADRGLPAWAPAFQEATAAFLRGEVRWHVPMAGYTTFKVGGPAEAVVFPRDRRELGLLVQALAAIRVPWQVLGRGSNVVIGDAGLAGVVIVFGREFAKIELLEEAAETALVRVEAGCALARLVGWAVKRGLAGLEFAAGIPGSVGGAIVMNAGAWKREMKDLLTAVTVMDEQGRITTRPMAQMHFVYRSWGEKKGTIAVEGFFQLRKGDPVELRAICAEHEQRRKVLQPQHMASGGSFFKNPPGGRTAGQLIDAAGLKGRTVGGAMVSPVHANFIVNTGRATAQDIIELMGIVQEKVRGQFAVALEPEVKILGRP
jgi:UDP-N-acetylmuramate dehydrogenase